MKVNELIKAIRAEGKTIPHNATKPELEEIYAGLHVHSIPEPEPEKESEKTPEPEPEVEEQPEPEKEPENAPEEPNTEENEPPETPEEEKEPDEEKTPTVGQSDFDELLGKVKAADIPKTEKKIEKPIIEKTSKRRKKGESSPDSFRMEGYILLLIVDTVYPVTLAFLNNLFDKKLKIEATDLKLEEHDFKKLEPLADQAADYMSFNINPIAGFALVSTFMYANNLLALRVTMSKT